MPGLLTFAVENNRLALMARDVQEVVRAVATAPLPGAPEPVVGVINVRGTLVPVLDIRARFGWTTTPLALEQHFILARAGPRLVALWVDRALELLEVATEAITAPDEVVPGARYVGGVVRLADGVLVIHDLARFLSLDEAHELDSVLATAEPAAGATT